MNMLLLLLLMLPHGGSLNKWAASIDDYNAVLAKMEAMNDDKASSLTARGAAYAKIKQWCAAGLAEEESPPPSPHSQPSPSASRSSTSPRARAGSPSAKGSPTCR